MTRNILASIETQRCPVTDKQIEFFAYVLGVEVGDLFPAKKHFSGQVVGLKTEIRTRRRCPKRKPRSRVPLARRAKK